MHRYSRARLILQTCSLFCSGKTSVDESSTPLSAVPDVEKPNGIQATSTSENIHLSPTGTGSALPSTLTVPDISTLSISETSDGILLADTNISPENGTPFPAITEKRQAPLHLFFN
ncbi:hypothetical protein HS088_TW07G00525 [Tripterygium wilfordii]|uniref:Uncharacterized protein n=1 Tax=Tripterygium wilfordii TaxID=458696 RepID=A0A7J7DF73_TRIWF|nr:hypothetical protein HS088_TW07G00525 [Tripterygium wilfordii]